MAECKLGLANGQPDTLCEEESCLFWRFVDHLDVDQSGWSGCAIQHFSMLDGGQDIAVWLLSAKERVLADAKRACAQGALSSDPAVTASSKDS